MRYSDIPKLTSIGSYQINVSLCSVERKIAYYTESANLDMNPDFQRGHVWTQEQQTAYIEYLYRGGQSGRVVYFNCAGFASGRRSTPMVLVDGKQRLTAVLRFLNDELRVFGCLCSEITGYHTEHIDLLFNINNLETRAEVLKWYLEMNGGGTPHTQEELDRVAALLAAEAMREAERAAGVEVAG